jgi:class 3 adenylate cyclase/TM2 domain-containing membrane protein YozV
MSTDGLKRRLAAILSADVKEYTRLMRDDEAATIRTLNSYREVMSKLIRQHHGRVVDSPGDNLLAEFASVVDGVQAAVSIQKELKTLNAGLAAKRRMEFRIGINLGEIIEEEHRIYGDGVNLAARLEALADPGGLCISRTAYDQIEDKLPFGYEYLGDQSVKNIPKPIHAYKVVIEPDRFSKKIGGQISKYLRKDKQPVELQSGLPQSKTNSEAASDKKRILALVLCAAFGIFGAHRFYTGRKKSGYFQAFTFGGLGIWYIVDLLIVILGEFVDREGRKVVRWI